MLKTSGLIIDVHDDLDGGVLRSFFPTMDVVPESIKTAHALSDQERSSLPDDDYALVLLQDGQKMRKFACIDEGNTQLGVLYFLANGHKLPEEAQKTAAANLLTACGWYGIEPPVALEKIALGLSTVSKGLSLMSLPATVQGVGSQIKQNMGAVRAHEAMGNSVVTPHQMKMGEASGTSLMPNQPPPDMASKGTKIPPVKVASMGHLVQGQKGKGVEPDDTLNSPVKGEQLQSLPQRNGLGALVPWVDVAGKEAPSHTSEKKANIYALGDMYPLDSYLQVKAAANYFEEYGKQLSPEDRHEYCVNLVKRASALDIDVSDSVRKYGSEDYAEEVEIKIALDLRRNVLDDAAARLILDELEEKRAQIGPDLFCETLAEFDKVAGITHYYDQAIFDPYYSTYGEKVAEPFSFVNGNDMITDHDLIRFGKTMHKSLSSSFGEDFATEFRKDPVGIFKSMPLAQKKMIMHLAMDNAPGAEIVP